LRASKDGRLLSHPSRLAKGLAPQDDGPVSFKFQKIAKSISKMSLVAVRHSEILLRPRNPFKAV